MRRRQRADGNVTAVVILDLQGRSGGRSRAKAVRGGELDNTGTHGHGCGKGLFDPGHGVVVRVSGQPEFFDGGCMGNGDRFNRRVGGADKGGVQSIVVAVERDGQGEEIFGVSRAFMRLDSPPGNVLIWSCDVREFVELDQFAAFDDGLRPYQLAHGIGLINPGGSSCAPPR